MSVNRTIFNPIITSVAIPAVFVLSLFSLNQPTKTLRPAKQNKNTTGFFAKSELIIYYSTYFPPFCIQDKNQLLHHRVTPLRPIRFHLSCKKRRVNSLDLQIISSLCSVAAGNKGFESN